MEIYKGCISITFVLQVLHNCVAITPTKLLLILIPTPDWSGTEAPPQCVLASGQRNELPGITEVCAPRPGSKKLHVCKLLLKCSFTNYNLACKVTAL